MSKKKIVLLSISAILVIVLVMLILASYSWFYTDAMHIKRIKKRAEKLYLSEDSQYTGLEVYPIYNEYDELNYALIEFEPQGFIYVHIADQAYPWKGMYTRSSTEPESWMPYRVKEGVNETIADANGDVIAQFFNQEFIRDENGQVIFYSDSHFKVARIENERRYFLSTECAVYIGFNHGLIPAVKRGEKYLDLIDGAMIDYTPGMKSTHAIAKIGFINKANFDL